MFVVKDSGDGNITGCWEYPLDDEGTQVTKISDTYYEVLWLGDIYSLFVVRSTPARVFNASYRGTLYHMYNIPLGYYTGDLKSGFTFTDSQGTSGTIKNGKFVGRWYVGKITGSEHDGKIGLLEL